MNLRDLASQHHILLGTCVSADLVRIQVDAGRYAQTVIENVNMIEPENDLKPAMIWRGPADYNFANSDFLLGAPGEQGWAIKNGFTVRGHVLVYARDEGYTMPRWLLNKEASISKDEAKAMLKEYITAVAGRYKGKVKIWDVINEAIDDQPNDRPFNLRNTFWFRKLGKEFLPIAFQFAHEADPDAKLYYNEYAVEEGGRKFEAMLQLADYVRSSGAKIDGLGLQYHARLENLVKPGDGHYKALESITEHKFHFMITELDVAIPCVPYPRGNAKRGIEPKDPSELEAQAAVYDSVFRMALGTGHCDGIQMWGITDRHSWIPDFAESFGAALIYDADYKKKPAYESVSKAIQR